MQTNVPDRLTPRRGLRRKKGYDMVRVQNESQLCFSLLPTESVWMWFRQKVCSQAYTQRSVVCEGSELEASVTRWSRKPALGLVYLSFNPCVSFISCVTMGILSTSLSFKGCTYTMSTIDSSQTHLEDYTINIGRDFVMLTTSRCSSSQLTSGQEEEREERREKASISNIFFFKTFFFY